jgi:hypothetical protein
VELQAARGLPTLLYAHLAAFGYRPDERATLEQLREAFGTDEDAGCTRDVPPASTVIAYNATGREVFVDAGFEPGIWRASAAADGSVGLERVRDGWRFGDLEADDELVVLPGGTVRPIGHGSHLVRVIRRGAAASTPAASALRDDVAAIMDAVVARVVARG